MRPCIIIEKKQNVNICYDTVSNYESILSLFSFGEFME